MSLIEPFEWYNTLHLIIAAIFGRDAFLFPGVLKRSQACPRVDHLSLGTVPTSPKLPPPPFAWPIDFVGRATELLWSFWLRSSTCGLPFLPQLFETIELSVEVFVVSLALFALRE